MSIKTTPGSRPQRFYRPEALAPRQAASYLCSKRGCSFTVTFLAGVIAPETWDCRCGGTGTLSGSELAGATDGSGQAWVSAKLHERRSPAELDQILAEALAEMRAGRRIGELAPASTAPARGKRSRRAA